MNKAMSRIHSFIHQLQFLSIFEGHLKSSSIVQMNQSLLLSFIAYSATYETDRLFSLVSFQDMRSNDQAIVVIL